MTEQQPPESPNIDPKAWSETMSQLAEKSQDVVKAFLARQKDGDQGMDPYNVGEAFFSYTQALMQNPAKMVEAQVNLWQDYMSLWQSTAQRMMGMDVAAVASPAKGDKRFKHEAWEEHQLFDFIKQSYLLTARWMQDRVKDAEGLDDKTAQKVDFYTRQFVDALSPSNFLMTNPEALQATADSNGENLVKGLDNLLKDLERGKGKLKISMTDETAFKMGENIAVTPGKVIYQNELMQLLQYEPTTDKVFKRPLLIIPPWINKFYILDLRAKNSFIRWAVEQGHTVFVISWVNPDEKLAAKHFEDYMLEGPLDALNAIEKATGEKDANVIGYCLGGTLLSCTLSYMAAKKDKRIKSATFFTTMTDFENPGELGVFIDEAQLTAMEEKMNERGFLEGAEMAETFNMLRANDLIWSFVVNNYLLGKDPFPFDLLYWNSDSTRMPAAMHAFYLRNMYLENKLVEPGGITLAGVPMDLTKIDVPSCMISTREDHIAPWQATYALTQHVKGPMKFILAASGHIAGVVNPPEAGKYNYWTNEKTPKDPEAWLKGAKEHPGSWWPEWQTWVAKKAGAKIAARKPGSGKLKVLEDAPGSYVAAK